MAQVQEESPAVVQSEPKTDSTMSQGSQSSTQDSDAFEDAQDTVKTEHTLVEDSQNDTQSAEEAAQKDSETLVQEKEGGVFSEGGDDGLTSEAHVDGVTSDGGEPGDGVTGNGSEPSDGGEPGDGVTGNGSEPSDGGEPSDDVAGDTSQTGDGVTGEGGEPSDDMTGDANEPGDGGTSGGGEPGDSVTGDGGEPGDGVTGDASEPGDGVTGDASEPGDGGASGGGEPGDSVTGDVGEPSDCVNGDSGVACEAGELGDVVTSEGGEACDVEQVSTEQTPPTNKDGIVDQPDSSPDDLSSDEENIPRRRRRNLSAESELSDESKLHVGSEAGGAGEDNDEWEARDEEGELNQPEKAEQEDTQSPMYVPMKGKFFQHDFRLGDGEEQPEVIVEEVTSRADTVERWGHDLYVQSQQGPRTREERERDAKLWSSRGEGYGRGGRGRMRLGGFMKSEDRERLRSDTRRERSRDQERMSQDIDRRRSQNDNRQSGFRTNERSHDYKGRSRDNNGRSNDHQRRDQTDRRRPPNEGRDQQGGRGQQGGRRNRDRQRNERRQAARREVSPEEEWPSLDETATSLSTTPQWPVAPHPSDSTDTAESAQSNTLSPTKENQPQTGNRPPHSKNRSKSPQTRHSRESTPKATTELQPEEQNTLQSAQTTPPRNRSLFNTSRQGVTTTSSGELPKNQQGMTFSLSRQRELIVRTSGKGRGRGRGIPKEGSERRVGRRPIRPVREDKTDSAPPSTKNEDTHMQEVSESNQFPIVRDSPSLNRRSLTGGSSDKEKDVDQGDSKQQQEALPQFPAGAVRPKRYSTRRQKTEGMDSGAAPPTHQPITSDGLLPTPTPSHPSHMFNALQLEQMMQSQQEMLTSPEALSYQAMMGQQNPMLLQQMQFMWFQQQQALQQSMMQAGAPMLPMHPLQENPTHPASREGVVPQSGGTAGDGFYSTPGGLFVPNLEQQLRAQEQSAARSRSQAIPIVPPKEDP